MPFAHHEQAEHRGHYRMLGYVSYMPLRGNGIKVVGAFFPLCIQTGLHLLNFINKTSQFKLTVQKINELDHIGSREDLEFASFSATFTNVHFSKLFPFLMESKALDFLGMLLMIFGVTMK